MTPFVLVMLCTLAIGLGTSVYLWNVRRREAEMAAGLTALAAMRWRDFAALVLRMLGERGYSAINPHPLGSGDQRDFIMQRVGEQCVVSCRHGSAYHLNAGDLKELGDSIRMQDAASGKLVTAGQFTPDAQSEAIRQRIELIDGATLWPEVAPLLPAAQLRHLQAIAAGKAKREIGVAWLFTVIVGVAIAVLMPRFASEPAETSAPASASVATQPQVATTPALESQSPPSLPEPPQSEAQQRQQALTAITALPDVERALWSTQSTMSVYLLADKQQPWTDICDVLSRFEAVRAVRVQLTPPAGSASQVRFRQCFAY